MKTIEEKAKAYDEALEDMRVIYPNLKGDVKLAVEHAFPQLRESEDERIRRTLVEYFGTGVKADFVRGVPIQKIRDWLEKQEQKPLSPDEKMNHPLYLEGFDVGREVGKVEAEQKPISSCDIVPYIDDKIAALQDMWREEKVSFDWDDMKDMIEDVARHFYHKEQKPRIEICPHSIKSKSYRENGVPTESISDELVDIIKGEFEGFRTLLKKKGIDYEPQRGYWEGFARLFDSSAREYVKGQKEQRPERINVTEMVAKYRATDEYVDGNYIGKPVNCMIRAYEQGIRDTLLKIKEQKPAEWSEEDEKKLELVTDCIYKFYPDPVMKYKLKDWLTQRLRSLRSRHITYALDAPLCYDNDMNPIYPPINHWEPSEEEKDNISILLCMIDSMDSISLPSGTLRISGEKRRELKEFINRPSRKLSEDQIYTLERICSNLHLRASDDAPKLDEIIELLKQK